MKKLSVKTKRILAAVGGVLIVLALLLAVDAAGGDPLSRAWSRRAAVAYAQNLYPGQTFTVINSWDGQIFHYCNEVQSNQSPDTRFTVQTSCWLFTNDDIGEGMTDHAYNVENRYNTCRRLEGEAARRFAALDAVQNADWYAGNGWMLLCEPPQSNEMGYLCTQQLSPQSAERLPLDAPLTADLLREADALLTVDWRWPDETPPTEAEQDEALHTLKALAEANGMPARYYRLSFISPDSTPGMQNTLLQLPDTAAEDIP